MLKKLFIKYFVQKVANDIFYNNLFKLVPAEEINYRRELAREYDLACDEIEERHNILTNYCRLVIINNFTKRGLKHSLFFLLQERQVCRVPIRIKVQGSLKKTNDFLNNVVKKRNILPILNKYGLMGVDALRDATPRDSGTTAESWRYVIRGRNGYYNINWTNDNMSDGVPVVILIQYGQATKNGAFVQGRDFINPALEPIFKQMADELWKELTK